MFAMITLSLCIQGLEWSSVVRAGRVSHGCPPTGCYQSPHTDPKSQPGPVVRHTLQSVCLQADWGKLLSLVPISLKYHFR